MVANLWLKLLLILSIYSPVAIKGTSDSHIYVIVSSVTLYMIVDSHVSHCQHCQTLGNKWFPHTFHLLLGLCQLWQAHPFMTCRQPNLAVPYSLILGFIWGPSHVHDVPDTRNQISTVSFITEATIFNILIFYVSHKVNLKLSKLAILRAPKRLWRRGAQFLDHYFAACFM
jgi:hypothetical protein